MKKYYRLITVLLIFVLAISTTSCSFSNNQTVATINGNKITKDEFKFYLTQVKKAVEQEQKQDNNDVADFWNTAEIDGKKAIDAAKERAMNQAVMDKLLEIKAKENGFKITNEQKKLIEEQRQQAITQIGGEDKYNEWLADNGLNDKLYSEFLKRSFYQKLLIDKVVKATDSEIEQYYQDKIRRVKHVLIMTVDEQTQQPLSEDKIAAARKKAEEILAKAKSGEDFDKLVADYSEDPGSKSSPDGYVIGEGFILGSQGSMVSEFENAAFQLQENGISEIVESNYGYHIIKRYPNNEEIFTSNKEEITTRAKAIKLEELMTTWKNEAKIIVNESVYKTINFNS